eukprot:COSAG06_NODE_1107_length_10634_cov_44.531903_9_plen_80_part_00
MLIIIIIIIIIIMLVVMTDQLLGNPIGKEGARALINLYESHEKIATLIGIKETDTALDLKGMHVDYVPTTYYMPIVGTP